MLIVFYENQVLNFQLSLQFLLEVFNQMKDAKNRLCFGQFFSFMKKVIKRAQKQDAPEDRERLFFIRIGKFFQSSFADLTRMNELKKQNKILLKRAMQRK